MKCYTFEKKSIFIDMKSITEYQDYRCYMQDYYDERKRVSSFSWREFARIAGFTSPTYLKLVCEKKNAPFICRGRKSRCRDALGGV